MSSSYLLLTYLMPKDKKLVVPARDKAEFSLRRLRVERLDVQLSSDSIPDYPESRYSH